MFIRCEKSLETALLRVKLGIIGGMQTRNRLLLLYQVVNRNASLQYRRDVRQNSYSICIGRMKKGNNGIGLISKGGFSACKQ